MAHAASLVILGKRYGLPGIDDFIFVHSRGIKPRLRTPFAILRTPPGPGIDDRTRVQPATAAFVTHTVGGLAQFFCRAFPFKKQCLIKRRGRAAAYNTLTYFIQHKKYLFLFRTAKLQNRPHNPYTSTAVMSPHDCLMTDEIGHILQKMERIGTAPGFANFSPSKDVIFAQPKSRRNLW